MKKLINRTADIVREMLEGTVGLNPGLALLDTETSSSGRACRLRPIARLP